MAATKAKKKQDYPYSEYADEKQAYLYRNFPSTHYLSNPVNVHHVFLWSTFFQRNLHRLAMDYLGIKLHVYQMLILYLMGISKFICIIACRAAAKSFIIALYACCKAIVKPNSQIVLGSATRGQSKLIVSEKIKNELCRMSPALQKEIKEIKDSANETTVTFWNGSTIKVFTANENARGIRSTDAVREEFRQIDKHIDDSIISPFQTIRQAQFMLDPYYASIEILKEDPIDIYISSSWIDNGHWMWGIADNAYKDMLNGQPSALLAFDESITLLHNIRTQKQMQRERKKQDPLTWMIEFLNLRVKNNTSAFFTYSMLTDAQTLKQVFYPPSHEDVRMGKKNKYAIPKQNGEIRVVSCDIAFVEGKKNDNSIYSCVRGIPETMTYTNSDNANFEMKLGYKRQYPYIESNQLGDTIKQAVRIRQLYEDWEADYLVIDARNGGIGIIYALQKPLWDNERKIEYPPLKCMNNDTYAASCTDQSAPAVIFAVAASQQLNSDIASSFRRSLMEHRSEFLVNYNSAKEEILEENEEYINEYDIDKQLQFEAPFLETQAMITETSELLYERNPQTGIIKIYEQGNNRKDRYTSVSYASIFYDYLEQDLSSTQEESGYLCLLN